MDNSGIIDAINAGRALAEPTLIGKTQVAHIPNNYTTVNLEKYLERPTQKRGNAVLHDADSFIAYLADHRDADSRIFAKLTPSTAMFVCVLDFHQAEVDLPRWCQHTATFSPQNTVEWNRWLKRDRVPMTQVEFAEFLEENSKQIVAPDAVKMIEIALEFQAKTNVEFASAVRQANGNVAFKYEEVTEAKGKGEMEVPTELTLGIVLFEGGEAYAIHARLRYRIEHKQLKFWYELINPHLIIKDALSSIQDKIEEESGVPIFNGEAPTVSR